MAATWNASGTNIYLDGELKNSHGYAGGIPNYSTELIGTSSWGDYFKGYIDEVRIWSIARDSAQINSTMLDTLSSDYYSTGDSGLVAYYRMDMLEDLGINGDGADDLRDLSINGNHLDTYGDPMVDQSGAFIITNVVQTNSEIPSQYKLSQNYPNPFNPSTKIRFIIAEQSFTSLKIYDVLGNEVATLVNEEKSPGKYEVEFNAGNLASGVYVYELHSGKYFAAKKMLFLK